MWRYYTCSKVTGWPFSVAPVDVTGIEFGWISCSFCTLRIVLSFITKQIKKLYIKTTLSLNGLLTTSACIINDKWLLFHYFSFSHFDSAKVQFIISVWVSISQNDCEKWKTRISRIGTGVGRSQPIISEQTSPLSTESSGVKKRGWGEIDRLCEAWERVVLHFSQKKEIVNKSNLDQIWRQILFSLKYQ